MSNTISDAAPTTTYPPYFVGFYVSDNIWSASVCNAGSTWSTSSTMGRCCSQGGTCYFFRSCLNGNTAIEANSGINAPCATNQVCATETIFQSYPTISPLSHIVCLNAGVSPTMAWHNIQVAASSTSISLSSIIPSQTASPSNNPTQQSEPLNTAAPVNSTVPIVTQHSSGPSKGLIIGASVGGVLLLLVLAALVGVVYFLNRRISSLSKRESRQPSYFSSPYGSEPLPSGSISKDIGFGATTYPPNEPYMLHSQSPLSPMISPMMPTTPEMARPREGSMASFAGATVLTPTIVNMSPVYVSPPQELSSIPQRRELYELSAELPSRMPSRRGRESRQSIVTEIEMGDTPDTSPTEPTK